MRQTEDGLMFKIYLAADTNWMNNVLNISLSSYNMELNIMYYIYPPLIHKTPK